VRVMPVASSTPSRRQIDRFSVWSGCEGLGQFQADVAGRVEQVEELSLLAVIRTGRIARGRPDAAVALGDQFVV